MKELKSTQTATVFAGKTRGFRTDQSPWGYLKVEDLQDGDLPEGVTVKTLESLGDRVWVQIENSLAEPVLIEEGALLAKVKTGEVQHNRPLPPRKFIEVETKNTVEFSSHVGGPASEEEEPSGE